MNATDLSFTAALLWARCGQAISRESLPQAISYAMVGGQRGRFDIQFYDRSRLNLNIAPSEFLVECMYCEATRTISITPYTPSQDDILANDWCVVDGTGIGPFRRKARNEALKKGLHSDDAADGHNPDKLTNDQVGVVEGWRLLETDEIKVRERLHKEIECWQGDRWDGASWWGNEPENTYRTRLSREDLAKLK